MGEEGTLRYRVGTSSGECPVTTDCGVTTALSRDARPSWAMFLAPGSPRGAVRDASRTGTPLAHHTAPTAQHTARNTAERADGC